MFYKIQTGYGVNDYVEITEDELEKAFYCFLEGKNSIYSGGAVKGASIISIKPDFHRIMGWNKGYKLGPEDYGELAEKQIDLKTQRKLSDVKQRVEYLMQSNQTNLIGTGKDLKQLAF